MVCVLYWNDIDRGFSTKGKRKCRRGASRQNGDRKLQERERERKIDKERLQKDRGSVWGKKENKVDGYVGESVGKKA